MRRQHVVVGGDDAEVGRLVARERRLVARAAHGKAMGEIAAGQDRAVGGAACAARRSVRDRFRGSRCERWRMRSVMAWMSCPGGHCGHSSFAVGPFVRRRARPVLVTVPRTRSTGASRMLQHGANGQSSHLPATRCQHLALLLALDMQSDEAGGDEACERQGDTRLDRARRRHIVQIAAARRSSRSRKVRRVREEGCRVAVTAHAEHDDIERPVEPGKLVGSCPEGVRRVGVAP